MELRKQTVGYTFAAALAILANTVLMIAKEENAPLKAAMKGLLGHHWTTHGVLIILLFLLLGYLCARFLRIRSFLLIAFLVVSVVAGGLGIIGFYLLE